MWNPNGSIALRLTEQKTLVLAACLLLGLGQGCDGGINGDETAEGTTTSLSIAGTSSSIVSGQCAGFTVTNRNSAGTLSPVQSNTDIRLSTSGSGSFYSDSICVTALTNNTVTIAAGNAAASFYLKDSSTGSPTITASSTDPNITGSTSDPLSVTPTLAFTTTPSSESGCTTFSSAPVVTAQTGGGSTVTSFAGTVAVAAYTDSSCTAAAPGAVSGSSVAASSGVATLSSFKYTMTSGTTASIYLKATSSTAGSSTCVGPVSVAASAASKLGFSVQPPATGTAGAALAPTIVVAVQDACGFTKTAATNAVTLAAKSNNTCATAYPGGTFAGGTATAAVAGLASFASVSETLAGNLYLQATAAGLTSACSTVSAISGATANKFLLSLTQFPQINTCSLQVAQMADTYGNLTTKGVAQTVNLAATGSAGLYSDAACTNVATSVSIAAGASTANFYVKDAVSESVTVSLTDPGAVLTTATLGEFVNTWTEIANFQDTAGQDCIVQKGKKGASGAFYMLNQQGVSGGGNLTQVWKSANDGVTWSKLKSFSYGAGLSTVLFSGLDVSAEGSGKLFFAGGGVNSSGANAWFAFKSTDGGTTWSQIITNYQLNANVSSVAQAVSYDAANDYIYVSGYGDNGSAISTAIVRTSHDGGATWSDYTTQYSAGKSSKVTESYVDSAGNLYITLQANDASNATHAVTMRSTDHGVSFAQVDDYVYVAGQASRGLLIQGDGLNNVWITGFGTDAGAKQTAVARMSTTGNAGTFATVGGNFQYVANKSAQGRSLFDFAGDGATLYFGGPSQGTDSIFYHTVRKSTDSGVTWSVVDRAPYAIGFLSDSMGISKTSGGKAISIGYGYDSTNKAHCIVRREP